eukprot:CAMPEP_0178686330 /NCGR_PEP_ID=MMETSP0699-20121125/3863_1 /TAXON_ID=265572 /ORGANISM="Extubocellulus spinifer, Strain CCMP396" /LENGTH=52 /DNA_ID=CAMNT_0020331151 /DNA_START=118 /DNA_END=273 /DNA_ORIENTATION=+
MKFLASATLALAAGSCSAFAPPAAKTFGVSSRGNVVSLNMAEDDGPLPFFAQ